MSTDDQIISRAHGLAEDVDETGGEVTVILGGARAARLDPDALTGLTGAALALGQNPMEVYAAGPPLYDPHRTDGDFLAAVSDAEDETAEIIAQAKRLQEETEAALREARAAYDAAAHECGGGAAAGRDGRRGGAGPGPRRGPARRRRDHQARGARPAPPPGRAGGSRRHLPGRLRPDTPRREAAR
jgi:hypothetical protein